MHKHNRVPDGCNTRKDMVVLPFGHIILTGRKKHIGRVLRPLTVPKTIGDHIRQKRLALNLYQKDLALIIGVSTDTITFWENDRVKPNKKYQKKIIEFLKYDPLVT